MLGGRRPVFVASNVVDAVGPDAENLPAIVTVVEAESDQERVAVHLHLADGGTATGLSAPGVPRQHLGTVAARRLGTPRWTPVHVGAQESAQLIEVPVVEGIADLVGDPARGDGHPGPASSSVPFVVSHAPYSTSTLAAVPSFDPQEMVVRFRQRAEAVRSRGMPPIEGPERQRFREQAQRDYTDFAMIGDAQAELVDGILTLRIDLRPGGGADANG